MPLSTLRPATTPNEDLHSLARHRPGPQVTPLTEHAHRGRPAHGTLPVLRREEASALEDGLCVGLLLGGRPGGRLVPALAGFDVAPARGIGGTTPA